ncbi:MAG TPA: SDR family oxidoreductase [Patescibacteria group bacterium]|nr:SDR family oxidoreductase [Patescibacteria group bacterium]
MPGRLNGKVAIVTGAGTGIGEAIAHKFAHEGAMVVVSGAEKDPVEDVAKAILERGGKAVFHTGDISQVAEAKACVEKAIHEFGALNILVNNAGVFPDMEETQDYDIRDFEFLIRNNITTVFLMTKFALPYLQKTRGNIVSAGSEAGFNGIAEMTPYGGTKAWVHAFMKGVALEQAKYGVRANCVCPGPIDTAWTHKETGPMTKKMEKMLISSTPLGRRGTPEEIANVYAFLASDEASYVTGALWLADGGITITKSNVGDQVPADIARQPEGILKLKHSRDGKPDQV